MSENRPSAESLRHHVRPMIGRNPHEQNRVATPLELLFDLTFALAFGQAASKFAHLLAEGHFAVALLGFAFSSFGICWAWINFSWFSSAYDTDDWIFRLATMVQMIGVLIFAIGLPRMFASLEHGERLDNVIMVAGYVVMRVAMVFQWLRAAKQDPSRRGICSTYALAISVCQLGWIAMIFVHLSLAASFAATTILVIAEVMGPIVAERKGTGTPWHAHHIAERYSLFAIIALGEGLVGTVATLSAVVESQGWTIDAVLVCTAGVGLTFGMWWIYYMLPSGHILHRHRDRSFIWGYSQMMIIAAIVATGAGLHVAAYFIEHQSHLGAMATVLSVAIPVGIFLGLVYGLYYYLIRSFDRLHILLLSGTAAVVALAMFAAISGVSMAVCLIILMFAPVVTIIGYELSGHRYQAEALARDEQDH